MRRALSVFESSSDLSSWAVMVCIFVEVVWQECEEVVSGFWTEVIVGLLPQSRQLVSCGSFRIRKEVISAS